MSGPRAVVERVKLHMQVSVLHTSGLAQVKCLSMLISLVQMSYGMFDHCLISRCYLCYIHC